MVPIERITRDNVALCYMLKKTAGAPDWGPFRSPHIPGATARSERGRTGTGPGQGFFLASYSRISRFSASSVQARAAASSTSGCRRTL